MIPATIVEPPFGFVLLQLKECQNVTALPVQNSRCEEEFAAVCVHCLAQGRCLFRLVLLTVDYVHASRALKKVYGDIAHHQFGLNKSFCYTRTFMSPLTASGPVPNAKHSTHPSTTLQGLDSPGKFSQYCPGGTTVMCCWSPHKLGSYSVVSKFLFTIYM